MSIRIADGMQIFKCCLYFLNLNLSFLSGILLTFSALLAIRRFRQQRELKGDRLPLSTALKVIRVLFATCQKEMVYR
jgi:hypothetical protein